MASGEQSQENQAIDDSKNKSGSKSKIANASRPECCSESKLPPTPNGKNAAGDIPKERRERIKYWFEIAGIIAGIVGVIVLVWQSFQMAAATKATQQAVEVSIGQMKIMERQLYDSEAQQRAWLVIEDFAVVRGTNDINSAEAAKNPVYHPSFCIEVSYKLHNRGYTPATEISLEPVFVHPSQYEIFLWNCGHFPMSVTDARMGKYGKALTNALAHAFTNKSGFIQLKKWMTENPTPNPSKSGSSLAPGEARETRFTNYVGGSWGPVEETNFYNLPPSWYSLGDFRSGKMFLYVEIWISYRDIFNNAWIIGRSVVYEPGTDTFKPLNFYLNQYHQDQYKSKNP